MFRFYINSFTIICTQLNSDGAFYGWHLGMKCHANGNDGNETKRIEMEIKRETVGEDEEEEENGI